MLDHEESLSFTTSELRVLSKLVSASLCGSSPKLSTYESEVMLDRLEFKIWKMKIQLSESEERELAIIVPRESLQD